MSTDNNLVVFKTIANFTQALSEEFGKKQHSLELYCRLINKTTLAHDAPIKKHISAFTNFCISNKDAIISKDHTKITISNITYSDKVYINIKQILNWADTDTRDVIWSHLLTISALVDSTSNAKEILKSLEVQESNSTEHSGEESDFLSKLMEKIEGHIDPNATPMQAIASIMSSGILTDLISGMNTGISNGSLDLPKIMKSVQGMIGKMAAKNGNNKSSQDSMNMINGLMGMMGGAGGGSEAGTPDMAGMMQGLMGAMAGSAGGSAEAGTPDMAGMMKGLMGAMSGGSDAGTPDIAGMMQGLMGGTSNGGTPDLASMMQGLMSAIPKSPDSTTDSTTITEITGTIKDVE